MFEKAAKASEHKTLSGWIRHTLREAAQNEGYAVGDEPRGFGFNADSIAYLDYRAFSQRAQLGDVVGIIAVDTPRPDEVRRRVHELGSLSVFDPTDLVKQAEAVNATAVALRWVLNLLTLTIAALFVSNMLSRSVAERRLEFATLRAIGLPSRTWTMPVLAWRLARRKRRAETLERMRRFEVDRVVPAARLDALHLIVRQLRPR